MDTLQTLSEYRTLHPARFTYIQVPPESSHRLRSTSRDDDLAYSYRNIFAAVLRREPRLLHDLFSVEEFVLIQTNSSILAGMPTEGWGPSDAAGSLDHFFDYLTSQFKSSSQRKWELPISAGDLIEFLISGDRSQLDEVVNYVMTALRPFAINDFFPLPTLSLLARHSKLPEPDNTHAALSFLWFSAHLLLKSQLAIKLFEDAGLLDVLEQMLIHDFPGSTRDMLRTQDVARRDMQIATGIILGVLSAKGEYSSLARHLIEGHFKLFCLVFLPFVDHYTDINAFRLPHCDKDPPPDKQEFYNVLVHYLR